MLTLFDFPDPNLSSEQRTTTTVPLQQLFVLNSDFMVRNARALVARLNSGKETDDSSRIRTVFPLLYGRPVTQRELQLGLGFLAFIARVMWGRDAAQPELPMIVSTVIHVAVGALLLATTVILAIQVWRHVPVSFAERVPGREQKPVAA